MRLRLFERLGRLVGWRPGSQGDGTDPRTCGTDAGGRHRRNTGHLPPSAQARTADTRRRPALPPMQPPARLQKRSSPVGPSVAGLAAEVSAGPTPRRAGSRAGGPAPPPLPRNYSPGSGQAAAGPLARARPSAQGGMGRARIRETPFGAAPVETATRGESATRGQDGASQASTPGTPRQPWYQVVGGPAAARRAPGRPGLASAGNGAGAGKAQGLPAEKAQTQQASAQAAAAQAAWQAAVPLRGQPAVRAQAAGDPSTAALPFTAPHQRGHPVTADGRRHCGPLETILWRQWDATTTVPPPQVIAAIDRLAEFPRQLQEKLAAGLDGIYVGAGGVPDLDHMGALHGVQLPSGKATWDACAGAYGDHKIVVGTRPSPTPDVMCHEVGHALDDLDSPPGKWQSDSPEFRAIYDQCQPYIASDFHRQRGGLGRKEFFADSFAAIASAQRPALIDMLGGNTAIALRVMLYFNRRYGI